MCGKESLEKSFLLFVMGLKRLGNWFMRRLYHGEPAGIPDGGRGWMPGAGLLGFVLCRLLRLGDDQKESGVSLWEVSML